MATIEQIAARLRRLGPALTLDTLPIMARAVRGQLQTSIANAATPYGAAWKPRKRGGVAMQNALAAVGVAVVERTIVVRLTGVEARHHHGRSRGGVTRPVIPTGPLPKTWADAFKSIVDEAFTEAANHG